MSISSDDDTVSTKESDGEYDSEHYSDVDMRMEDDVDAPDGFDFDANVDMDRDGDDDEEEDEEEDEKKEDEDEDEDVDDGKEPRTIGQGEMVNTLADDVVTMVDDQPTMLPEQGQEMREHTPRTQPLAPAPRSQTPVPRPPPQTPVTHPHSALEFVGLVTPQKPRPVAPTLREVELAGNTSDLDVGQQQLRESAGGDSLPDVPLPTVPLQDVLFPYVPLPDARPDVSVGEEQMIPHGTEELRVRGRVGF